LRNVRCKSLIQQPWLEQARKLHVTVQDRCGVETAVVAAPVPEGVYGPVPASGTAAGSHGEWMWTQ